MVRFEHTSFFLKFFLMFVYFWWRKTEHEWGRGRERERETQNLIQAPGSELSVQSLTRDFKLTDHEIMTWAEVGHSTDWATQAPQIWTYFSAEIKLVESANRRRGVCDRSVPWVLVILRTLGRTPWWTGDENPDLLTHRRKETGMWTSGDRCSSGAQGLDVLHICHLVSTEMSPRLQNLVFVILSFAF